MAAPESNDFSGALHRFHVISVLGPPGVGKGTLCSHLAENYSLSHFSVGDSLREWMRANQGTALATTIQDKLDNQGFLDSENINPFIRKAIRAALEDPKIHGLLLDGYPRCTEQMLSFDSCPFEEQLQRRGGGLSTRPYLVLAVRADKAKARARYIGRSRDARYSTEKFEKRFTEYEIQTRPVEEVYRQRGLLVEVDVNGNPQESIAELERNLGQTQTWLDMRLAN